MAPIVTNLQWDEYKLYMFLSVPAPEAVLLVKSSKDSFPQTEPEQAQQNICRDNNSIYPVLCVCVIERLRDR